MCLVGNFDYGGALWISHCVGVSDDDFEDVVFDKFGVGTAVSFAVAHHFAHTGTKLVGTTYLSEELGNELAGLRNSILADPFFAGVPSIHDPKYQKTAAFFHAKNDLPEVRRDVFKILAKSDVKFRAIVRNKEILARHAAEKFAETGQKTSEDAIYDDMVKRLFRDSLHKHDQNEIIFAWRGSKDRKDSLEKAIKKAKHNFNVKWNKNHDVPTDVVSGFPRDHVGLQVVDYYLWALQRFYEQRDGRFFNYLSKQFRLVIDMDDTRKHGYGEFYTDQNPLSLEKIMPSVD